MHAIQFSGNDVAILQQAMKELVESQTAWVKDHPEDQEVLDGYKELQARIQTVYNAEYEDEQRPVKRYLSVWVANQDGEQEQQGELVLYADGTLEFKFVYPGSLDGLVQARTVLFVDDTQHLADADASFVKQ